MRASPLWPVVVLIIVVAGLGFAREHHRHRLNEDPQRAEREAAALQRPPPTTLDQDPF